jgi:CBS domain-containing protein
LLWSWRGRLSEATYLASRVGVFVASALMAFGMLRVLGGSVLAGTWLIVIGFFLRSSAQANYADAALRGTLGTLRVRDIMTHDVVSVPADTTAGELEDAFWRHHVSSFPVVDGGVARGIVSIEQLRDLPREHWLETRARDFMRPLGEEEIVSPSDTAVRALDKASCNGLGRLVVLEGPHMVGYLSLKDIAHVAVLRGPRDGVGGGGAAEKARALRDAA